MRFVGIGSDSYKRVFDELFSLSFLSRLSLSFLSWRNLDPLLVFSNLVFRVHGVHAVEPPNNRKDGTYLCVHYSEIVLYWEVFLLTSFLLPIIVITVDNTLSYTLVKE